MLPRLVRGALVFAGVAPWLPGLLDGVPVLEALGIALDAWFSMQCHREPERSLLIASKQLPVCARCFGIYLGLGLGALVLHPRLSPRVLRGWVVAAVLVMLVDVTSELFDMRPESALLRVGTGLCLAWPVSVHLVWAARERLRA